jgi:hypothetical protein
MRQHQDRGARATASSCHLQVSRLHV